SLITVTVCVLDGALLFQCTGIVYEFDDAIKTTKILTSSRICCKLWHPKLKVFVHLSNDTKVEARFLFFNKHYQVALLQIVTEHTLMPASFGSRPNYDQQVFFLGRDKDYLLIVRSGSILGLEQPFAGQNHYLFSRAGSPVACTGGPVIDKHGQVIGIM
uniref:Uncharacterized protein n=1 Tax=Triticum urartu TaxID=4572 RepID=A0A8R7UCV8_TRIUA